MNVKLIQEKLNELAMATPPLVIDGDVGKKTIAAVKKFQQSAGLAVDGQVGPQTLEALFKKSTVKPTSNVLSLRAMEWALSQEGVREKTGANDGEQVESYLKSIGLGKGYAWCMAFVYWCFNQAAKDLSIKNPLVKTGGVLRQYNESTAKKTKTPQIGDIFIMDYGKGLGHTGIVTAVRGTVIDTIEGNTNSAGSRNGDGVYKRVRDTANMKGFIRVENKAC